MIDSLTKYKTPFKTAVVYSRVSTEEQARHDLSLPFQRQTCEKYAKENGHEVIEFFEDAGISGKRAETRPSLMAMLDFALRNKIDAVIIHKFDRLARNMADFWQIANMLKEHKISLLSVAENFNMDTPAGMFGMGIMSSMSQFYIENLSQEIKKGQHQKIVKGEWPNKAPIGYENKTVGSRRIIKPIPEQAKLVTQAFELYATGNYSIEMITELMTKGGLTTRNGNAVTRSSISTMFKNPAYIGRIKWNGESYPGKHEAIIDEETFFKVQEILAIKCISGSRNRKHNFYMRGIIFCSCGRQMVGDIKTKKYKNGSIQQFFYMGCKSKVKNKTCSRVYVPMKLLEGQILDLFRPIQFSKQFQEMVMKKAKEIITDLRSGNSQEEKIINQRITLLNKRLVNAEDAMLDGTLSKLRFKQKREEIEGKIAECKRGLAKLNSNHKDVIDALANILEFTRNIYQTYYDADPAHRRKILQMFFHRIVVDDRQIIRIEYTPVIAYLERIQQVGLRRDSLRD